MAQSSFRGGGVRWSYGASGLRVQEGGGHDRAVLGGLFQEPHVRGFDRRGTSR